MALQKPYKRIWRPFINSGSCDHLINSEVAEDWVNLSQAYILIEKELLEIFEFIEPHYNHNDVYSHKTYILLLKAATEFEANCKKILMINGYTKDERSLTIKDYKKLNHPMRLSEYEASTSIGGKTFGPFSPFKIWDNGSLEWYRDYNSVKHSRQEMFYLANLKNVLDAVSGLLIILVAQFHIHALGNNSSRSHLSIEKSDRMVMDFNNSIFKISTPPKWPSEEKYNFQWSSHLEHEKGRYDNWNF